MLLKHEPRPDQVKAEKLYQQMGLSDEEFTLVENILGRTPNYTETGLFSVMWSEHCSYKNSKPVLKKFPITGEKVLQGPGEGAGIVDIGDVFVVPQLLHDDMLTSAQKEASRRALYPTLSPAAATAAPAPCVESLDSKPLAEPLTGNIKKCCHVLTLHQQPSRKRRARATR